MRILLFALLLAACSTVAREDDPIVGCWQRDGEGHSLLIEEHGHAHYELSYAALIAPVSYDFPEVRWTRRGEHYVIHFAETSLAGARSSDAHIENSELLIEGQSPLYRADSQTCRAYN